MTASVPTFKLASVLVSEGRFQQRRSGHPTRTLDLLVAVTPELCGAVPLATLARLVTMRLRKGRRQARAERVALIRWSAGHIDLWSLMGDFGDHFMASMEGSSPRP